MCGIFGWMVEARHAPDETTLRRLTDSLVHRGPDGSGIWRTRTPDGGHEVAFGHRRLSIIDLGGGHQPMASADGRITLTFNGEIYNYVELREELRGRGHVFRTDSDTEVLIEAYSAWGEECLDRLRGMFAFALFDAERQRVLLARDAFGKKPLFLAESHGRVAFSSEVAALLDLPGTKRDLDWAALDAFLIDRYVPGPATLFQGIRKLPPGSLAVWQDGALSVRRYFTPPFATTRPDVTDFGEAVRLFSNTFDEAVRLRMRSDAPFGAFLSGGVDSSAVVAAMSRHAREPVRTFAVGFAEAAYSELDHARTIAEHFRTDHTERVITPQDFLDAWPDALRALGAPLTNTSDVPILLLSRLARESVKMVLTGEGADELMAGYPKHRAERWTGLYAGVVPAAVHDRLVEPAIGALPYGLRRIKVLASALSERDQQARMRRWFGGMDDGDRAALTGRSSLEVIDPFPFSMRTGSNVRRALFFDQTSWLPDNLLERGDRMMMAASVEGRMPFMDVELARLVARFPDRFLTGHAKGKAVLRAAMAEVLPPAILNRKKVGFRVPFDAWLRGPFRDRLGDLLGSEASETRRILDPSVLDRLTREHVEGRRNHEKVLWSLVNLELFLRTFKPGLGARPATAAA
ncbi:asparagine synthase (glutamine-hydrolyzing) [Methylobacterium brachythecii]|uniref:asparagine synthase (glutamine-hydrolyzing) n=1 Tax=Methylobacterium brachythecii TaxID=1176177 RepID=A0A7W6AF34_9HYPH|nr:asparagine synthase (glutamine-hydrolyzing) [Methylobacterium brachythecii]MBB3902127.1 asparagine synthase (glutamine-hydrolyzing) [Methylobacterium brachythecii]GLS44524.1 asparagine synthetase B [Methylobacterium brachythecii]